MKIYLLPVVTYSLSVEVPPIRKMTSVSDLSHPANISIYLFSSF